jgi:anti-sigma regulatory factor (Ser/Thr protein kinase)
MPILTLPGELDSLGPIGDFVVAEAARAGLDRKAAYHLRLAVDELATNVVVHGYGESGLTGPIVVESRLSDESLAIVLEDDGPADDPRQRDQEQLESQFSTPLEERSIGGLGVYLALRLMDEFHYERVGQRNRSTLVVHRHAAAPAS